MHRSNLFLPCSFHPGFKQSASDTPAPRPLQQVHVNVRRKLPDNLLRDRPRIMDKVAIMLIRRPVIRWSTWKRVPASEIRQPFGYKDFLVRPGVRCPDRVTEHTCFVLGNETDAAFQHKVRCSVDMPDQFGILEQVFGIPACISGFQANLIDRPQVSLHGLPDIDALFRHFFDPAILLSDGVVGGARGADQCAISCTFTTYAG